MTSEDNSSRSGKSTNHRAYKKIARWFSTVLLVVSGLLCATLFSAHAFQPDFCAALTFWPVWIWAIPGIALCLAAIDEHLIRIPQSVPVVVGGDFNAKPWAGATKILSRRLYDTFRKGGFGWPGTGPSHLPLWRVDQIWASRHFKTISVHSENCEHSDHRIVICDLCKL